MSWSHPEFSIIWISQIWKGAIAAFTHKARITILENIPSRKRERVFKQKEVAEITIIEETAWIIKYLIAESEEKKEFLAIIIGTILRRLISNPSQIESQDEDEIVIRVPEIVKKKNKYI